MPDLFAILIVTAAAYVMTGAIYVTGLTADALRHDPEFAVLAALPSRSARLARVTVTVVTIACWPMMLAVGTVMALRVRWRS